MKALKDCAGLKEKTWTQYMNGYCVALLICAVLISVVTTYVATELYLDGDASAELVLAEHLAQTKQIISEDWYYSTELRVLNTQLIHAPLFLLFEDWHMVRFVGALILQAIMAACYLFMIRRTGASLQAQCIGTALLILPTSVAYGRIVLYHTYYAPHIIIGFLIVGLYLATIEKKRTVRLVYACMLLLISFLSGLGGVRQFVITHAPLVLLGVYGICLRAHEESIWDVVKVRRQEVLLSVLAAAAFVAGFLVNHIVLYEKYNFVQLAESELNLDNLERIPELIFGILHQFGFRRDIPVLSLVGIASVIGLFTGVYVLVQGVRSVSRMKVQENTARLVVSGFFAASMLTAVGVSLLTGEANEYTRHLIPATVWAIPLLCMCWDNTFASPKQMRIGHVLAAMAIGVWLVNAVINAGYFCWIDDCLWQRYEGLDDNDEVVDQLEGPLEAARQRGYTVGYSDRWESCTLTEMTDGEVLVIPLDFSKDYQNMYYDHWLSLHSYHDIRPERTFLILPIHLDEYYAELPIEDLGEKIYQEWPYVAYGLENPDALLDYLEKNCEGCEEE